MYRRKQETWSSSSHVSSFRTSSAQYRNTPHNNTMNGYSEEDIKNAMLYQEQMKKAQEEQTALTLKLAGLLAFALWAVPTAVHFAKKSLA